jgi:hypothetical protein
VGSPALKDGIVFYASAAPPSVAAISALDGQKLGEFPLPSAPRTGPVLSGEMAAAGTEAGIFGFSVLDPSVNWHSRCGEPLAVLVCDDRHVGCVTAGAEIALLDWQGKEKFRGRNAAPGIPPMLCGDTLLYLTPESVERLDIPGGKTERWLSRIEWLGKATTPAVMIDSQMFFGTESKGLVCIRPK